MTTGLMVLTGCVALILLCWKDFKGKILKPKSENYRYYSALALFLIVNVLIYLGLCSLFLGQDPIKLLLSTENAVDSRKLLQPILIALMYFGTGAAKFKIGKIEINFYEKMLDVFQGIFSMSFAKINDIRKSIEDTTVQCQTIECKIKELHDIADQKGWDKLQDRWKDVSDDTEMFNKQIEEFTSIHKSLDIEPISHNNIDQIKDDIKQKIEDLRTKVVDKLKKYFFAFVVTNVKNEKDIENILNDLKVFLPKVSISQRPNVIYRCLVISFVFGILFGPIMSIKNPEMGDPVYLSWYGALSLSVFGVILSQIRKAKEGYYDLIQTIIWGIIAGAAGYLTWNVLTLQLQFLEKWKEVLGRMIIGIEYGVAVAMLLYVFRLYIGNRISSLLLKYTGIGASGVIIFIILALLNPDPNSVSQGSIEFIKSGLLGLVVMLAMALGIDIFGADEDA